VGGKDIVLELLRRWGAKQSQGMSVEFVDRDRQLPMVSRNTIANMMARPKPSTAFLRRTRSPGTGTAARVSPSCRIRWWRRSQRRLCDRRDVRAGRRRAHDRQAV
jgi:hypothetical protein